jgi:hypothetical protein
MAPSTVEQGRDSFQQLCARHGVHRTVIGRLLPSQGLTPAHPNANSETNMFRHALTLLDLLGAQADYRSVQLNYLNLVVSHLEAANQLNLAAGREVIQ